jgi:hypothetical protein
MELSSNTMIPSASARLEPAEILKTARGILFVVKAFKTFSVLATEYLVAEGIGWIGEDGLIRANPDDYYNLNAFLRAFRRIGRDVGNSVLVDAGRAVVDEAVLPPQIRSTESALRLLDAAYHMNHMKNGRLMLDPLSRRMQEGIGHFLYLPEGPNQGSVVCDTPYPCEFDLGVIDGMAKRFEPDALVLHDGRSCRKRGDYSCSYHVSW